MERPVERPPLLPEARRSVQNFCHGTWDGGTRLPKEQEGGEDGAGRHFGRTEIMTRVEMRTPVRHKNSTSYDGTAALNTHAGGNPLPVTFWGKVNEAATVTVKGEPAKVDSDNEFRKTVDLNANTQPQQVAVVAKDYGQAPGNTTTRNANLIVQGGTARTLLYDANGNLTNHVAGGVTTVYEWDAEDRLLSVRTGSQMSKFYYDGFSRRTKIEEGTYSGGVFTPTTGLTKKLIWVGGTIAEERNASDVVQKKFYGFGEWRNGVGNLYYARDHLGNLRELTDNSNVVRARYEYDPYGRRSANLITGGNALEADWGGASRGTITTPRAPCTWRGSGPMTPIWAGGFRGIRLRRLVG